MKIKRALKKHVEFKQLNLIEAPYPWENKFDLILCRNVFIYFPREVIQHVVENLFRSASEISALLNSHSESLLHIYHAWKSVKPSIFVKG